MKDLEKENQKLRDKIEELYKKNIALSEEIDDLTGEISDLEYAISDLEQDILDLELNGEHPFSSDIYDKMKELRYLVDIAKIEFLVENIDNIMLEDLENLIKR